MIFNPRFVIYAKAHGMSPEAMLEHDAAAWPGGKMCGFILWMSKCKAEFTQQHPEAVFDGHIVDHQAYDEFLERKLA